ncbi:MAG: DRTGG domain-containing protein [Dehalococcoidia bacterium]
MIIYFYSNKPKAGKSLILSAFSYLLSEKNIKNIAINPILNNSSNDTQQTQSNFNALLSQNTKFKPKDITQVKSKQSIDDLSKEIEGLAKKYKIVLVEVNNDISSKLKVVSSSTKSKNLLVNEFSKNGNIKEINNFKNLDWIIYNKIPKYRSSYMESSIKPKLKENSEKIIATIPETRLLNSMTIDQLKTFLNAEYIIEENTDMLIENYLIGTPRMDSGKDYYSSYENSAVIIRTDRPDIQMSAIYQNVKCLILAGKNDIADYVMYEAQERNIPLIQIDSDTMETAKRINFITNNIDPFNPTKISSVAKIIKSQIDISKLFSV